MIPIKEAIISLLSYTPNLKIIYRYSISARITILNTLINHINLDLLITPVLLNNIGTTQNITINVKRKLGIRFGAVHVNNRISYFRISMGYITLNHKVFDFYHVLVIQKSLKLSAKNTSSASITPSTESTQKNHLMQSSISFL